jgi:HEAT repeat protein
LEQSPTLSDLQAQLHAVDADVRARALEQIGRLGQDDPDLLKTTYTEALSDPDGDVRAAAISGLSVLDAKGSIAVLSSAMSDADASVRLAALDGLEVDEQTLPLIAGALSDEDESVRALAELRLGIQ